MHNFIRNQLREELEEVFNNAIDRAFAEGQLDQWGKDKVEYDKLKDEQKVATQFVDRGATSPPTPARYIDGRRVPESEWQRHLGGPGIDPDSVDLGGYAAQDRLEAETDEPQDWNPWCVCHHDYANHELEN